MNINTSLQYIRGRSQRLYMVIFKGWSGGVTGGKAVWWVTGGKAVWWVTGGKAVWWVTGGKASSLCL